MIFRVVRTSPHPVIQCASCLEETRYWDDRQAAKWKTAHAVNCPRYYRKETK